MCKLPAISRVVGKDLMLRLARQQPCPGPVKALSMLAGEAIFMGSVFFQPNGSLHIHGTDYNSRQSRPGIGIAPSQLKVSTLDGAHTCGLRPTNISKSTGM